MFPGQPPGFEADVALPPPTPEQVMENSENRVALYAAIDQLPPVQARRVYAHYLLGISRADLARAKGVGISRISGSIHRGLLNLKKFSKILFGREDFCPLIRLINRRLSNCDN